MELEENGAVSHAACTFIYFVAQFLHQIVSKTISSPERLRTLDDCIYSSVVKVSLQRSAKRLVRGWEKFLPALAYLLCLNLPRSCLARFTEWNKKVCKPC